MNVTLSRAMEAQVLEKCHRPFLVGNRKVIYKYGRYEVQRTTTDEVIKTYNDRGQAVYHAVMSSGSHL